MEISTLVPQDVSAWKGYLQRRWHRWHPSAVAETWTHRGPGGKHSRGQTLGRTQCHLQAKERFRRSVTLMIPRPWPFASRTVSRHLPVLCYCVRAMLVDAHDPPYSSISVAGEVCCWIWWAVPEILSSAATSKAWQRCRLRWQRVRAYSMRAAQVLSCTPTLTYKGPRKDLLCHRNVFHRGLLL